MDTVNENDVVIMLDDPDVYLNGSWKEFVESCQKIKAEANTSLNSIRFSGSYTTNTKIKKSVDSIQNDIDTIIIPTGEGSTLCLISNESEDNGIFFPCIDRDIADEVDQKAVSAVLYFMNERMKELKRLKQNIERLKKYISYLCKLVCQFYIESFSFPINIFKFEYFDLITTHKEIKGLKNLLIHFFTILNFNTNEKRKYLYRNLN